MKPLKKRLSSNFKIIFDDLKQFKKDAVNEAINMYRDFKSMAFISSVLVFLLTDFFLNF